MRIGVIIGRIGDVDGVALETEKWIEVLHRMGHEVYILSGRFKHTIVGSDKETLLPTLSFFSPNCEWEQNRAFFFPNDDPGELMSHLEKASDEVAGAIFDWVLKKRIDVIVAQNSIALPCHLSMGIGIRKAVQAMSIPMVAHNHDFFWERGDRYKTPHKELNQIIEDTFPMNLPNVKHAVINLAAKDDLKKRLGVDATVVPNVMDFTAPYAIKDDYNKELKSDLGLKADDIPLFQITRIVKRKGIEVAIDLIHRLDDPRIKLVITGSTADDERKGYYKELIDHIEKRKLNDRVIFAHKLILSDRCRSYEGNKIYSLEDAYAHSAACTYFSSYEGFGNAFVECILAKKPIFVNNYKPVYWPDIGSKGFKSVMLEENNLTDQAVKEMKEVIFNSELQKEIADHNFHLGKHHFSFEVLEDKLRALMNF